MRNHILYTLSPLRNLVVVNKRSTDCLSHGFLTYTIVIPVLIYKYIPYPLGCSTPYKWNRSVSAKSR